MLADLARGVLVEEVGNSIFARLTLDTLLASLLAKLAENLMALELARLLNLLRFVVQLIVG